MQLVSFIYAGQPSFGIRAKGGLIDAGARANREFPTLAEVLRAGALKKFDEMAHLSPDLDIGSVQILPPIPHPAKIICVGLNYKSHAVESGNELPENPSLFLRRQPGCRLRTGSLWSSQRYQISLTMKENWRL
jgi:2-keto-4-pentenoate hydratase/2-oxohepta-3-ene-1,7-dioic acid hydratase in catechol pathway